MSQLINDKAVYRTAPATLGPLNIIMARQKYTYDTKRFYDKKPN